MRRLVVVGGGLAGCLAAFAGRAAGAAVTLLYRAPGATALLPGSLILSDGTSGAPPWHPLKRAGFSAPELEAAHVEATAILLQALAAGGERYLGDRQLTDEYLDCFGRPWAANFVPESVAPGRLSSLRGEKVSVVDVGPLSDHDARAVAEGLQQAGALPELCSAALPDLPPGPVLADLLGRRAPELPSGLPGRSAWPPGFESLPEGGFELLTRVASPHGWRLQQALWTALGRQEVELRRQTVLGLRVDGRRVLGAELPDETLAGDAFVLATGRFIGGGISKARDAVEPLLGLQLVHQGQPLETALPRLRHTEYFDSSEAFQTGAVAGPRLRAVAGGGEFEFENVWLAGTMLGGCDTAFTCGLPLVSGWLAGQAAA